MSALKLAIELYKSGFGPKESARIANKGLLEHYIKYNVPVNLKKPTTTILSVRSSVYQQGLSHHYNKALTPAYIEQVRKERAKGKTYQAIADKYGVAPQTIWRYVNE
jgi:hypothetical protein